MSKYIIDGYFLVEKRPVGLHRFSNEILKNLDRYYDCSDIEVAVPCIRDVSLKLNNIKITEVQGKLYHYGTLGFRLWKQIAFPLYAKREKAFAIDMAFAQQTIKCDVCGVFDCITIKCPGDFKGIKSKVSRYFNIKRIKKSAKKASIVITLSRDAKNDIIKFINIPESKIRIVSCGWEHVNDISFDDSIFNDLPQTIKKGNYYFSLGSQYLHKNIEWVFQAAQQNPNEYFVVTGTKYSNSNTEFNLPNIIYTGYLSDEKIKSLMKWAKAFIQPSFYEGFGIPPMEALSVGCPIIVSNQSSLPEIYEGSAHYIDPYNYKNITINRILDNPVDDASTVLQKYSWKKAAKQFYDILKELE